MLLMQFINLIWYKECRGAPYATTRQEMEKAYFLPENIFDKHYLNVEKSSRVKSHHLPNDFFDHNPLGCPAHCVSFIQHKKGITAQSDRILFHSPRESVRLGAVEAIPKENNFELEYRYDYHRAIPERHKYDPDTCLYVPLRERAMVLGPNEYGRITYNGRFSGYDTGTWYYELGIINAIHIDQKIVPLDCFIRNPDKQYKQMAILR